ncbi:hypothetical protein ACYOEI_25410 [Singulisphaera rosea]
MDRTLAYATLAAELERWRRRPLDDLISLVDAPPSVTAIDVGGAVIDVEIRVRRASDGSIRIEADANGPSWWRLERLEEAITRSLPGAAGD